ncbi:hypothetical protein [Nocardioides sp. SYSU D00065]|uniref:hypothetical protein n=1 Tax=Nocardioides sp. SYSU D00065 TaxID=2817378 RepID=UPI001B31B6F9|nr:hypothetical protein [Nocardioides sp. SYSU D00065]
MTVTDDHRTSRLDEAYDRGFEPGDDHLDGGEALPADDPWAIALAESTATARRALDEQAAYDATLQRAAS